MSTHTADSPAALPAPQAAGYADLNGSKVLFKHRDGEVTIYSRSFGRVRLTNGGCRSAKPVAR